VSGLTEEEILARLRSLITYECTQKHLAARTGLSSTHISLMLSGKSRPSKKILELIKVRRVVTRIVTYEEIKP
jgi:transcriptional regulator with XRE-family HTH domain